MAAASYFLHGARLTRETVLKAVTHWRLHLVVLAFTFVFFPLLGLLLRPFGSGLLTAELQAGFLFLCAVPSTVQSSIAFTALFVRGSRRRDWIEGLRFGLLIWLLYFVPMTLGIYGYFSVGDTWPVLAILAGLAEALACSLVATLAARPARATSTAGFDAAGA